MCLSFSRLSCTGRVNAIPIHARLARMRKVKFMKGGGDFSILGVESLSPIVSVMSVSERIERVTEREIKE